RSPRSSARPPSPTSSPPPASASPVGGPTLPATSRFPWPWREKQVTSLDREQVFVDDFDGGDLDMSVWTPHYLPAWSSRSASAATYTVEESCLRLSIPPDQGLWCADDHTPP